MLGRCEVYCDDILNFSKTREEHLVHVRMVLETLRHHKLYTKVSKCQFGRSSVGVAWSSQATAVALGGRKGLRLGGAPLLVSSNSVTPARPASLPSPCWVVLRYTATISSFSNVSLVAPPSASSAIPEPGVAVDCRNESQRFCRAERATPTCCTDARRFGGLANYYLKFVQRLSSLAAPLTAL